MSAFCTSREKERQVLASTNSVCSPGTPFKSGKRNLGGKQNDSSCICCGLNLYGAGSSYNLRTHEDLAKKIGELIQHNINPRKSSRVCKSCFRRVQSLAKKSSVLETDLTDFRKKFAKNSLAGSGSVQNKENVGLPLPATPESSGKRLAEWSPPPLSAKKPRSRLSGQLFFSDGIEKEASTVVPDVNDNGTVDNSTEIQFVKVILRFKNRMIILRN